MPITMKNTRRFLASLALASAALYSSAGEIIYFDLSNPSRQLVVTERGVSLGKMLLPIEICSSASEYTCFSGAGVSFAAPKHAKKTDRWQHAQVDYTVTARQKMLLLGNAVDAVFIDASGPNETTFKYIYSYEHGLISIGIKLRGEEIRLFVLEDRCGFGAAADCK